MDGAGVPPIVATEVSIKCDEKSCHLEKEVCQNKKNIKSNKELINRFKKVISGKQNIDEGGYYDNAIVDLAEAAISGDLEALALMKKSASEFKADGAAAEALNDGKHFINHLIKLGCLK